MALKKILKNSLFIVLFFVICLSDIILINKSYAYNIKFKEKDYVEKYCTGQKEFILEDKTRVDCLTTEYAIEFDYAKKWAESIGQSLYYAKKTGKKPAVAIIIKKPSDKKYIDRIKEVDKDITIFEIMSEDCKK